MKDNIPAVEPTVKENLEELMLLQNRVRLKGPEKKNKSRGKSADKGKKSRKDKNMEKAERSCEREMAEFEEFYKFQNDLEAIKQSLQRHQDKAQAEIDEARLRLEAERRAGWFSRFNFGSDDSPAKRSRSEQREGMRTRL